MITSIRPPIQSLQNGNYGWLLRWHERVPLKRTQMRHYTNEYCEVPRIQSYFYVDRGEAFAVYHAMKQGATFEEAHSRLVAEWTSNTTTTSTK